MLSCHLRSACLALFASSVLLGSTARSNELSDGPRLAGAIEPQPAIMIRPRNFDPDSPWEYTLRRGELAPGMAADGKSWNRPRLAPVQQANTVQPAHAEFFRTQGESRSIAAAADVVTTEAQAPERIAPAAAAPGSATETHAIPALGPAPLRLTYEQAYNSIPFSRAEYEANPGYRHEAAMELMFGVLRPTTIMKQTIPYFSRYPDVYRYRYPVFPYQHSTPDAPLFNSFWNSVWGW